MVVTEKPRFEIETIVKNLDRKLPNLCLGRSTDDPLDNVICPAYQRKRYRISMYKRNAPTLYHQDLNNVLAAVKRLDENAERYFVAKQKNIR